MDPKTEFYYSWTPYKYGLNNPILFLDPNGNWDITVHVYNDRKKYGYGVAVVTDAKGNEVARYDVRVIGQSRNRMKTYGDTPLGVYDIPDRKMWMSGGDTEAFGPNNRLIINPESGEAKKSGRTDFRMHGGRQQEGDEVSDPNEPLQATNGCIRMYDDDIADLKSKTDELMKSDLLEIGGKLKIIADLEEVTVHSSENSVSFVVKYQVPKEELAYWKNFVHSILNNESEEEEDNNQK